MRIDTYLHQQGKYASRTKASEAIERGEIKLNGKVVTKEEVEEFHKKGYGVRAWNMSDEQVMAQTVEKGVDGMTVNFPDKLTEYLKNK
jgi:glycerophosphoryl diester phosphodiesterase